jgi:hypothetical protein
MLEHDYEPVAGLPGQLPEGERLLWQGRPEWWPLARRALRVGALALYFALLSAWIAASAWRSTHTLAAAAHALIVPLTIFSAVLVLLIAYAWYSARATLYSITTRRIVMRHGVALTLSLNLPFSQIEAVNLCTRADGTGDLALSLNPSQRAGYMLNWPHVRPGHYGHPQPLLRAIPEPARVAQLLTRALSASSPNAEPLAPLAPRATEQGSPTPAARSRSENTPVQHAHA